MSKPCIVDTEAFLNGVKFKVTAYEYAAISRALEHAKVDPRKRGSRKFRHPRRPLSGKAQGSGSTTGQRQESVLSRERFPFGF
jgi:hypothetical protein